MNTICLSVIVGAFFENCTMLSNIVKHYSHVCLTLCSQVYYLAIIMIVNSITSQWWGNEINLSCRMSDKKGCNERLLHCPLSPGASIVFLPSCQFWGEHVVWMLRCRCHLPSQSLWIEWLRNEPEGPATPPPNLHRLKKKYVRSKSQSNTSD